MQIIPVIDLKDGLVVHAKQGKRDRYAPLHSPLCPNADALELIRAFQGQFRFSTLYIADLNAITRQGSNKNLIADILLNFQDTEFWLDCGFPLPAFGSLPANNYVPIVGSESLTETDLHKLLGLSRDFVLSLDFSNTGPRGAEPLFTDTAYWPEKIIIMTLAKVGSSLGPALDLLSTYCKSHPQHTFIAAGGIRGIQDLEDLEKIGIAHCLIASAFHNGNLSASDIAGMQAKKYPG